MTFPNAASFISGAPNAAWWKYQSGTTDTMACQSQGMTVEKNCQRYLRTNGTIADTIWDRPVSRLLITIDGIFGPNTCKVLAATLTERGIGSECLADLGLDFAVNNRINASGNDYSTPGATLHEGTVRAMIWAASHELGDPNRVVLPPNSVLPRWGVAPANDGAVTGIITCWNLRTDQRPVSSAETASGGGATPPPTSGGEIVRAPASTPAAGASDNEKALLWVGGGLGLAALVGGIAVVASRKGRR